MSVVYVDAETFKGYAADRGVTLTTDQASQEVRKAQDYIDNAYTYVGVAVNSDSAFPRTGIRLYDATTVPPIIQEITKRVALMAINGADIYAGANTAPVKREIIASNKIETEYDTQSNHTIATKDAILFPSITRLLSDAELIISVGTGVNFFGLRG